MGEVKIKKKSGAFPVASQADADALYFKTETNNVQMKLGGLPLKHDIVSLSFSHSQSSSSTDCVLEAMSDYIKTVYDGLKIIVSNITDASTVGYRYGSSTNIIRINTQDHYMIYNADGSGRLTKEDIEPGGVARAVLLQFVSSLESGSGGWIIIGQYNVIPRTGGTVVGNIEFNGSALLVFEDYSGIVFDGSGGLSFEGTNGIDMNNNAIVGLPSAYEAGQPVEYSQTMVLEDNQYDAGNHTIINVPIPTSNRHVANKQYVDNKVATSVLQDCSVSNIDGSKDFNVAYVYGTTPIRGTVQFTTPMEANKLCHIMVYCAGTTQSPGTYDNSTGYVRIPANIAVAGQDGTANNNYVWLNGVLVHGGGVSANLKYFKIPREAGSNSGMLEISIFYTTFTPRGGSLQHRTFIKADGEPKFEPAG